MPRHSCSWAWVIVLAALAWAGPLGAQSRAVVLKDRAEYEAWLRRGDQSPLPESLRQTDLLSWYPYDGGLVFLSRLLPDGSDAVYQVVSDEGTLMTVTTAGTMVVGVGGSVSRLRVWRLPAPPGGIEEFEVHFVDATNADVTHPAGRFVTLIPLPEGRFLLDFNRASNPFCAYAPERACPPRSQASVILGPVPVGERAALFR